MICSRWAERVTDVKELEFRIFCSHKALNSLLPLALPFLSILPIAERKKNT